MNELKLDDVLSVRQTFPCKIELREADLLKEHFTLLPSIKKDIFNTKTLRYRYQMDYEGFSYILLEEYMFREKETDFELKHAIAINYYLNRIEEKE